MAVVGDVLGGRLKLVSPGNKRGSVDLFAAIAGGQPTMTRTIDGASTIEIPVADHKRTLLRSQVVEGRSWAVVNKLHFELVKIRKSGNIMTLVFEDAVVTALRRETGRLSIPAGTITRADFMKRLGREVRVPVLVDPAKRGKVQSALKRSVGGEKSDSWTVAGEAAEAVRWRRFSDGHRLIAGSDEWLLERVPALRLAERSPGVASDIDFDLDVGKRVSEASFSVDTADWAIPPGQPVTLVDMGPADGKWLVAEISGPLAQPRDTIRLVRARHVLKEPKREPGPGDRGDTNFVPGQDGDKGGGTAGNGAREVMVAFALSQAGDSYVWGGNGPSGWDCSGLVQGATAAAGKQLSKPSASQWGTCVAQGKTIPISQALGIRGALLFRIGGTYNHVAISLGNGSTIEAKGSAYGTNVFGGAAGGGWTGAALWL